MSNKASSTPLNDHVIVSPASESVALNVDTAVEFSLILTKFDD